MQQRLRVDKKFGEPRKVGDEGGMASEGGEDCFEGFERSDERWRGGGEDAGCAKSERRVCRLLRKASILVFGASNSANR